MGQQHSPEKLARFLDYILGRRPDEFGLVPDGEGFVGIKDLLKVMQEEEGWRFVREGALNEVVVTLPEAPVEIAGKRIRAVRRELLPGPVSPEALPKLLYTAVRERAHAAVLEKGILPMGGLPHVVLSSDRAMAERIGSRIDPDPLIITVQVEWANQRGVRILQYGEMLFLAPSIPVGAFLAPPLPKEKPEIPLPRKLEEAPARPKTPGSFTLTLAEIEEKVTVRRERRKKEITREKDRRQMRKQKHERWS